MQQIDTIPVFSVFSGTLQEVPKSSVMSLGLGQLPLLKKPKDNCNKCYGRLYQGRDVNNLSYVPCKCVNKNINLESLKEIEEKHFQLSK